MEETRLKNEFDIMILLEVLLKDELIADIHNFGDFMLVKLDNEHLFKISCQQVKKPEKDTTKTGRKKRN